MEFNALVAAQGISAMTGHFCGTTILKAPYLITDFETLVTTPTACSNQKRCPHCGNASPKQAYAKGHGVKTTNLM
jgi:hypothetical protein